MDRESIAREIAARFNNREGNITDLAAEYEGYSRYKFYRDIKKLGIVKDDEKDIYIIPDDNIDGQINLLEQVGPEMQEEEKGILDPIGDPPDEREGQDMQQDIKNKDVIVTDPPEEKEIDLFYGIGTPEKKKKTFEIDVELEKYIRIQAAIEDTTINEWVNKTLWKAIPEDTKEFIGD